MEALRKKAGGDWMQKTANCVLKYMRGIILVHNMFKPDKTNDRAAYYVANLIRCLTCVFFMV